MKSKLSQKNNAGHIIIITSILSIGYAALRYHIAGNVAWKDFPFFILNKGISLAGFLLLTLNFAIGPLKNLGVNVHEGWLNARKAIGLTGFLYILIHVLMSLILFKAEVYGKFFEENGMLTLMGELSMLGGIIAFILLWGYNLSFQTYMREDKEFIKFISSRKFLLIAMLFSIVHLFFMGYEGWLNTSAWQAGLPPISLLSFAFFAIGYGINLAGRK